ncbi:MAG: class A beta-lactamase [Woeseiaceae bacterium]|nr:class A beta-lactamase [Woeseiaceae bacterium]
MKTFLTTLLAALALSVALPLDAREAALERELQRIAGTSGGTMGVGVLHLESGRGAWLNPDEAFPMASTYKVPLAVEVLHRVDAGRLGLDDMIDIAHDDYAPGSGMLAKLLDDPGLSVSVLNLLEIMLLISDNTATDVLLNLVGGGAPVTERMQALGIDDLRVDRTTSRLIGDWLGLEDMPSASGRRWEDYEALVEELPEGETEAAAAAFETDPRDNSTPRAMTELLAQIWRREALSAASSALLIDIMERCETGEARLKGRLPEETVVAHKTGTIGRTTNDVGIVYLPGDAGHVVVVGFVKDSDLPVPERERAIADAARAAHDYFLFAP